MASWKTLEDFEKDLLKDGRFRREFESLEPEYQIARTILSARQAIGMSQQALAKKIGTSQSRISLWERAEEVPRLETLKKIANATGVSFHIGIAPDPSGRQAKSKPKPQLVKTRASGSGSVAVRKTARKATASRKTAARKTSARKSTGRKR